MRVTVLSETELRQIISEAVRNALALLPSQDHNHKMTRQAAATYLGVSLSTMDRIARRHPDLIRKNRDKAGRPFYWSDDLDRYLQYVGKKKSA